MSYLGFKYVGLDRLVLGSGYDVAADFKDSGGIFVNAEVTYRGVAVGRVSDMKLDPRRGPRRPHHQARRRHDPRRHRGVRRHAQRGRRAVRASCSPTSDKGPFLKDGSVIPKSRTGIPVPVEQLMLNLDKLASSIDQEHLRIVVDELGKAFAGSGDDPRPAHRQRRTCCSPAPSSRCRRR